MTDYVREGTGDADDLVEREPVIPLSMLRTRMPNIIELSQREVDYVFARLRAAADSGHA